MHTQVQSNGKAKPSGRCSGQVAVVTGGTQGIGKGIVLALLKEDAKVVFCSRSAHKGAAMMAELDELGLASGAKYLRADVGDKADVENIVEQAVSSYGRLDVLVNNAQSFNTYLSISDKPDEHFDISLRTGLYATLWAMRAAYPQMKAQGGGRIINFCSINSVTGAKYSSCYNANKEAIRGLTKTAAREWGVDNITVNVIAPAGLTEVAKTWFESTPAAAEFVKSTVPLGRTGDCEADIGALILGLASEEAGYITGQTFFADGGLFLVNALPDGVAGMEMPQ